MKTTTVIVLWLLAFQAIGAAQRCDSLAAVFSGGWKPVSSAPRDGTVVEMLETYGVAPWYGLFKWTREYAATNFPDGKIVRGQSASSSWQSVDDPGSSVSEDHCLFWRPYRGTGKYVDPTGGAQKTVAYTCAALKLPYDKKTDRCVAR